MQGTRLTRRNRIIIFAVISVVLLAVLLAADQLSKLYFGNLLKNGGKSVVIENFFYFEYTLNEGSAYGFLADKPWAKTFFLVLTPIAVALFIIFYVYAYKKNYKTLLFAVLLIIGGALGNYIDRLFVGAVTDFICLEIAGNRIFGIFNLADVFLSAGVVMVIIHLFFLDENAIFIRKKEDGKEVSG